MCVFIGLSAPLDKIFHSLSSRSATRCEVQEMGPLISIGTDIDVSTLTRPTKVSERIERMQSRSEWHYLLKRGEVDTPHARISPRGVIVEIWQARRYDDANVRLVLQQNLQMVGPPRRSPEECG